jgi:D-sedoheptulose 7-phosphate isomerase
VRREKEETIMTKDYIRQYLEETVTIANTVSQEEIEKGVDILRETKKNEGRLFILGVGGSAANASHAVNDFRKIGGIETYAPTDNVSELTARTNDEGWETTFAEWLKTSHLNGKDCIMVFSVGGGSETTSLNIVNALKLAKERGAKIISIVSRTGGYSKQVSDSCVLIPVVDDARITPHAEGWQGVVWHLMVNALVKC